MSLDAIYYVIAVIVVFGAILYVIWKGLFVWPRSPRPNKPTEKCIELLNKIILTDGTFDYEEAMFHLKDMQASNKLDLIEYLNLLDACNHRRKDGHYRNSLIYQRALKEETRCP